MPGVGSKEEPRANRNIPRPGLYKATLGEAVSLRTPQSPRERAVRKAQLDAFVRLVPATVLTQLVAAGVLVPTFRETVDSLSLGLWFDAATGLCFLRFVRAVRLRHDRDYAREHPPQMVTICLIVSALAALWLVPVIFWFDTATSDQRTFLCVLVAALMSAGMLTMVSVPPAALLYVTIMLTAITIITFSLNLMPMLFLALVYAGMLCWAVISNARHFIDHIRVRVELEERGEIIQLLFRQHRPGAGGRCRVNRSAIGTESYSDGAESDRTSPTCACRATTRCARRGGTR